ncbi:CpaF family protein [Enterorhabdus sp. P55]|jgi:pilus assembly protein CpaF|uniref:CpaF family protein n=1 Tax=Enterorhabdus sp. P55 TaxID=2304571 RepID=UPI0013700EB2|nr:CpaF family protein [Enterorhabdus sp. P55]MCI8451415.1 CpaF family protein [Eggerthellaceae bacterium]NBI31509.1 CpaF family protein [Enterorhabdus sp. P55]
MTLLERARTVGASRDVATAPRGATVEDLRRSVRRRLAMEKVAALMAENPERARNELRAACRQTFAEGGWERVSVEDRERLVNDLVDVVFGMGPIDGLLEDDTVTEVMVNGTQSIYYERQGRLHRSPAVFASDEQVRVLIDRIIGPLGRRIDEASPTVSARLPEGHRVHAIIPPLSPDGPLLTIRLFSRRVMTLDEMAAGGSFGDDFRQMLVWAVVARKNVAVSGGTGSGKTTLLNALSCHIPHGERVITIEDSAELKFTEHPHVVRLEARPSNAEGTGEVTIRELVINALRMRPDRIIVGECRGGEALDMLQAMNTGHEGSLTTLHANAPQEVVDRLVTMVRYAVDLPLDAVEAQIGNAFDLIVQTTRARDGTRFVSAAAEVSFDQRRRACELVPLYERGLGEACGQWLAEPSWVAQAARAGLIDGREVERWRRQLPWQVAR